MNYKTTYILFGILIAIVLAVSLSWWFEPTYEDTARFLFPSANGKTTTIAPEDVVKVVIDRKRPDAGALVFQRDESKAWNIVEPRPLRADSTRIDSLVSQALRAEAEERADAPRDLKTAELEPAAETITLTTKDGKELKLNTGAESPLGSDAVVYLDSSEKPDKPTPVLKRSISSFFQPLTSYRDSHLLASAVADYQKVVLSMNRADKKDESKGPLELTKHTDDGLWEYKDPSGYDGLAESGDANTPVDAAKPPAGVDALLRDLADLRVESGDKESDWVEDAPKDLDKYGLDPAKSDLLTLQVDRTLGAKDAQTASITLRVALGKKTDDKKYYAAVIDDKHGTSVVKVATAIPDAIALLFKDPSLLRNRSLVALGTRQPLAVTVTNAEGTFQLLREKGGAPWKLYRGTDGKDAEPVDAAAADSFVNQLMQDGQVREFLDPNSDKAKLGLDKPTAVISIYVDGVQPKQEWLTPLLKLDADKSKNPAAQLKFGAVEGNLVALLREANHAGWSDKPTLVKAPKEIGEMANRGLLYYHDKALPKFSTGFDMPEVVGLKLVRTRNWSISEYVLFRYKILPVLAASTAGLLDSNLGQGPLLTASALVPGRTPDQDNLDSLWQFLKPDDYHNSKVDAEQVDRVVLGTLLNLKANSLVAEKPTPEELDKYGLKTPALTVELTKQVGDKTETYTYSFGQEAPDGGVYAKQSQREMVFEVSKDIVNLLSEDLRDRTIFAFDPTKVKELKMTGWQKQTAGVGLTLDLERKDDKTWVVKAPANLNVDFGKVNKLVDDLSNLRAESFAPAGSPIQAEYAKEKPKSALTIEMKVDGVDAPYTLQVVDLTGDAALPNEADRQVYATTPQLPGQLFQVRRTIFTSPPRPPIGPIDDAGYFKLPS